MKKLMFLFAVLILIGFVGTISAENFIFKVDQEVDIKIACFDEDNNYCNSSVECNITILDPEMNTIINNQPMTFGDPLYNYTLNTTDMDSLFEHSVITICTGNTTGFSTFTFENTNTGREFSTAQGNVSIAILIGAIALSFLFLIFGIKLGQNEPTATLGFFFTIFSLILGIYVLHLSYVFTNDIIQYSSLTPVTSTIYTIILFSLAGIVIISAALMAIAMIKQLSETVKRKKFGEDFNPITNTYE